jgi:hypothetical protein
MNQTDGSVSLSSNGTKTRLDDYANSVDHTCIAIRNIYNMTIPLAKKNTDDSLSGCQRHSSVMIDYREENQRVDNHLFRLHNSRGHRFET